MFGGMGAPGERVTGRMDIWSELYVPILQTLAKFLLGVLCVLVAMLDIFLIQPIGYTIIVSVLLVVACIAIVSRAELTVKGITYQLPGIEPVTGKIVVSVIFAAILYVWVARGLDWLIILWVWFWPIFHIKILFWEWVLCTPCYDPPLLLVMFTLAVSFALFRAADLLNFRMHYEITDPNWPPTIMQRAWQTGHYGKDWRPFPVFEQDDQSTTTVSRRPMTENGGTTYSVYTPPPGVKWRHVLSTMQAIKRSGPDPDELFWWPGEGTIDGVPKTAHRKLQDDWQNLGYAVKQPDNHVLITELGVNMMNKILHDAK